MPNKQIDYYLSNPKYSQFLNQAQNKDFKLYSETVLSGLSPNDKFLDVGCGTGNAVSFIARTGVSAYGVEVSRSSLKLCKQKKGIYKIYDGGKLPFPDKYFATVGCWNVLEHVDNVELLLDEMKRVLDHGGRLIIGAPNLLSITNSYHRRTRGLVRKMQNLFITFHKLVKYFSNVPIKIEKIASIMNPVFSPDDDAVNIINPFDILKWGKLNNLVVVDHSGSLFSDSSFMGLIRSHTILKHISGGIFIVFKKL